MDGKCKLHAVVATALLGIGSCDTVVATDSHAGAVPVWKSPPPDSDARYIAAADAQAEDISIDIQLPKKFAPDATIRVEVANHRSDPVFVWTLVGDVVLKGEKKCENGFCPAGGNYVYCREGTELRRLDPGESILGSMLVGELSRTWNSAPPLRLEGDEAIEQKESVEGEFRLYAEFHSREHEGTTSPPDCDMRHLASPSFVIPRTEWSR